MGRTDAMSVDDRRATIASAGLVAAVVVVLGFGSGFWADLARTTSSGAAAPGRDLGTVVQPRPATGVAPSAGPAGGASTGAGAAPTATAAPTTSTIHHTAATAPMWSGPGSAGTPVTGAATCSAGTVAPFWTHFQKAHLETSPGQQVAEAASLDRYVATHTVLIAEMLTPIIEAVIGDEDGAGPFWTHFEKAHLETSPGQQAADALALDQYVQTHTVLVEDLLSPIVGAGCR